MSDADESRPVGGGLTLDELAALNDEIVALTRSGMPLERGLVETGRDLPGRLRRLVTDLGQRMSRGERLPEALDAMGAGVPKVYRAVVEAGLRTGRPAVALEGLAAYVRGLVDARRAIGLAMWYPLLVLALAYGLFVFIVAAVIPRFVQTFAMMNLPAHRSLVWLDRLGATAWYWGPVVPLLLAAFLAVWFGSKRALSLDRGRGPGVLRWFPWVGAMIRGFESAGFAELLALLVEQRVPYPEALRLAGGASGDVSLTRACEAMAASVERGDARGAVKAPGTALPPLLHWLIATGPLQGDLPSALRQSALRYRAEARFLSEKIRVLMPAVLLFAIGLTSTLLYALTVFVPLSQLWTAVTARS